MKYVSLREDCRVATYFGHRVELTPYKYTDFPRGHRNYFRLVSISQHFASPDNGMVKGGVPYVPTGEFYQDIYHFVTGDIAAKKFNPIKCARKAKEYVKRNYFVYPIRVNQKLKPVFFLIPMKELGKFVYNSPIVAAFVISKEDAMSYTLGTDKEYTLAETYELARKEVERQLAIYNYWYAGEIYLLQVYPSPMIRDALVATGEVGAQIVSEWEHKLIPLKAELFGWSLSGYNEDLVRLRFHMNAISAWVFDQINKFGDADMPPRIKRNVKMLLSGLGD